MMKNTIYFILILSVLVLNSVLLAIEDAQDFMNFIDAFDHQKQMPVSPDEFANLNDDEFSATFVDAILEDDYTLLLHLWAYGDREKFEQVKRNIFQGFEDDEEIPPFHSYIDLMIKLTKIYEERDLRTNIVANKLSAYSPCKNRHKFINGFPTTSPLKILKLVCKEFYNQSNHIEASVQQADAQYNIDPAVLDLVNAPNFTSLLNAIRGYLDNLQLLQTEAADAEIQDFKEKVQEFLGSKFALELEGTEDMRRNAYHARSLFQDS